MESKTFTIETRLEAVPELTNYCNPFITDYSKIFRIVWQIMTAHDYKTKYAKDSYLITKICTDYNLLKRTVNSIVRDIKGRMNSYMEIKNTELQSILNKLQKVECKVYGLKETINKLKQKVTVNQASEKELATYRKAKQSLYYQQNKLNKLKHKVEKLRNIIDNRIYSIGFGGKQMFRKQFHLAENGYKSHEKWYHDYVRARDKNIYYLGASDESYGNQLLQMTYNSETDDFTLQIRKENNYCKDSSDKYIIIEHVQFKHLHDDLAATVIEHEKVIDCQTRPLTYQVRRVNSKWYLKVMFRINIAFCRTCSDGGVLGLDYNEGFIELSETNKEGNLVCQEHYDLKHHGTGNKAKSEIEETIARIVSYATKRGKDIIIEDLDFSKKKSKTITAKSQSGKTYNRMIHLFDYHRYTETMENTAFRNGVCVRKVNPAYTTQIGKQKFCKRMKLNAHQAASYTIARRGQGFKDKLIKTKPRKLAS